MSAEIDELLQRLEQHSNCCSMLGVPVILRPGDVFVLVEALKDMRAERDVLRETVGKIASRWVDDPVSYAAETIGQLYARTAPAPVEYIQSRQE